VCPRAVLDAVVKRKIPTSRQDSNSDRPARSLVAVPTEKLRRASLFEPNTFRIQYRRVSAVPS
jgi:hypothetical protein